MTTSPESELPALPELRFDLARNDVHMLHPATSAYAEIASDLATQMESLTGKRPDVSEESEVIPDSGSVIVLGNIMESTVVRRLYLEAYDFTDLAFPGEGGFTLRTIRDPFATGAHVILVGGSDSVGVQTAANELVTEMKKHGPVLSYLNKVRLGKWTTVEEIDPVRLLADTDKVWSRVGASGSWEYMERIALAGVGYLRTADEQYLKLFRRELHHFIDHDVYHPNTEAKSMLHGRMHILLIVWDLVQDHPLFESDERRKVDTMFLFVGRSEEGVAYIRERCRATSVRFNHATRAGLDAFFIGRYFQRRYQLPESAEWLRDAETLFSVQFTSCKPMEDSWGHQWAASMHNVLVYAMAAGRLDYVETQAFLDVADRALIAHGTIGPRVYLAACSVATRDPRYLSFEHDGEAMIRAAARLQLGTTFDPEKPPYFEEVLRSFAWTAETGQREDLLGLSVAPLDPLWTKSIKLPEFSPQGIFASTLSPEEGFDKIGIREGWTDDDFYLLLDGISGGVHAYQDVNCIVWMRFGGAEWFKPRPGMKHAMGARSHTGLNTALNGRVAEQVHRYARLLYQDTQGDTMAMGTALSCVGETIWERHIVRCRGAWTLVIDRVVARESGELLVERFWYPHGERSMTKDGFACRQALPDGDVELRVAVTSADHLCSGDSLLERRRTEVAAGDSTTIAALLWTNCDSASTEWSVSEERGGYLVAGEHGQQTHVTILAEQSTGCGLKIESAGQVYVLGRKAESLALENIPEIAPVSANSEWPPVLREISVGDEHLLAVVAKATRHAVGTESGLVIVFDSTMHELWRAKVEGMILSLEISGEEIVVGEDSGAITLFDREGHLLWSRKIPWVTIPWAYWSEGRSRIREIAVADINGNGVDEILVSNADRRVYAFDRSGNELWKCPIEWGVYTSMSPGTYDGEFALLGGTARPAIFGFVKLIGSDGTVRGHFERPDLIAWSMPSAIRDLQQVDIDGDGKLETVELVDANLRQLVAYTANGEEKWSCDLAASGGALAYDAKSRRVYATSDAGYVVAVESASGDRLWYTWIGESAELLWILADGSLLAVARRGALWVISPDGEVLNIREFNEAITAIPRPGNHRGPERKLILGTASGCLFIEA